MAYLLTAGILLLCFGALGVGVLFFGRRDIGAECGSIPNHKTGECPSKKAGVCPTQRDDHTLDMALMFSKFHKIKNRDVLRSDSPPD